MKTVYFLHIANSLTQKFIINLFDAIKSGIVLFILSVQKYNAHISLHQQESHSYSRGRFLLQVL